MLTFALEGSNDCVFRIITFPMINFKAAPIRNIKSYSGFMCYDSGRVGLVASYLKL